LNNTEDVDGRRTTRSSTRGSTAASKLKNEPPAKKEKKTPSVKGTFRYKIPHFEHVYLINLTIN